MSPEKIKLKVESFAHGEFNRKDITNIESIKNKINKNKDIFNRNISFQKVQIDDSFPEYIVKNIQKFSEFII